MQKFHVHSGTSTAKFDDTGSLLSHIESLLGTREPLTVSLPRLAIDAIHGVAELLERNRIKMVVMTDSSPEAVDYVAQTLLGGTIGSVGGIIGGAWTLTVLSRLGYLIPGVRWFVTAAALVGCVFGAVAGFAATRMGLRARFVRGDMLQLDLVPLR